jgi:hypothetical protein
MVKQTVLSLLYAGLLAIFISGMFYVAFTTVFEEPQYLSQACQPVKVGVETEPTYNQAACDAANANYDLQMQDYNLKLFIYSIVLAIAFATIALLIKVEAISWGLLLSAIFWALFGSMRYWNQLDKYSRLGLLTVATGLTLWIGYKKLKN